MKQFMERLKTAENLYTDLPTNTEADKKNKQLKNYFLKVEGKRALYLDKTEKEARVVTIKKALDTFVVAEYNYYGMTYTGKTTCCIQYSSLLCGDAKVDIENE